MLPVHWIRCALFPTLLFSSHQSPGTDASGSRTYHYKCSCPYGDKVYNLAPLQTDEGDDPRVFFADGTQDWRYAYSPCRSFSIDDGQCTGGNVAVCAWDKGGQGKGNYMLIGCQSDFFCTEDEQTSKPQLEYISKIQGSRVVIRLECNRSLVTPDDAEFVVNDDFILDPYIFTLSHKCACPNGCPEETPSSSPPPSSPPSTSTATVINCVLGSLLAVALCVFAVVLFRKRCTDIDNERRRLMDENGPSGRENLTYQSNNESRHLADEENNSSQHQIDSFIKNPIEGKRSQSPSNNIREFKKDNVNKLNALS